MFRYIYIFFLLMGFVSNAHSLALPSFTQDPAIIRSEQLLRQILKNPDYVEFRDEIQLLLNDPSSWSGPIIKNGKILFAVTTMNTGKIYLGSNIDAWKAIRSMDTFDSIQLQVLELPNDRSLSHVEYKFRHTTQDGFESWFMDDANPFITRTDDGYENSLIILNPTRDSFNIFIKSRILDGSIMYAPVQFHYFPGTIVSNQKPRLLLVNDAGDYLNKYDPNILNQLEVLNEIPNMDPIIVLLVPPFDIDRRHYQYIPDADENETKAIQQDLPFNGDAKGKEFANFFNQKVMAALMKQGIIRSTRDHAVLGVSLSGLWSTYLALRPDSPFSQIALQSPSFWVDSIARGIKDHSLVMNPDSRKMIYISYGSQESPLLRQGIHKFIADLSRNASVKEVEVKAEDRSRIQRWSHLLLDPSRGVTIVHRIIQDGTHDWNHWISDLDFLLPIILGSVNQNSAFNDPIDLSA